jgi:hypothetical protein
VKYRQNVQVYEETQADTATKILDLDLPDPISALEIEVSCQNGATSNKDNFISDIVTKIEVVDGAEVFYSVSMAQLQALQFFKTGRMPWMHPSAFSSGYQSEQAWILFGRYLNDPEFVFQPSRYRNPQLKITFNKAAIRAAGGEGFKDEANIKLSVTDHIIQEGAAPRGFLSARQVYSYLTLSTGEKRIDLLTDFPTRLLMIRAWLQEYDVSELFTDVKLTFDSDKYILLNRKMQKLEYDALTMFGEGMMKHDFFVSSEEKVRVVFNKDPYANYLSGVIGQPNIYVETYPYASSLCPYIYDDTGAEETTDRLIYAYVRGHSPHAIVPIVMGLMDKPETWMDMSSYKKAELVLTQAVGGAVGEIVQEQVRT